MCDKSGVPKWWRYIVEYVVWGVSYTHERPQKRAHSKKERQKKISKKGKREMRVEEAYLKNIQAEYRYYCYHVHNDGKKSSDSLSWVPSKFHIYLCNAIDEFVQKDTDKAFEVLILNTPPQHGKSVTITETYPSYYLMRNPESKVIAISYGDDLAERFGKRNLEKVEAYGNLFGISVNKKKATSKEFELSNKKGRCISKGLGSGITGQQANLVIIDDPIKNAKEASSERIRNGIWAEFDQIVKSRLSAKGKIVLIMTRWHEDDLAGKIMSEYANRTTVINLPCEAEENDLLGREVGEALCPEIGKGNEWLKDFKSTHASEQGLRSWNALYQGRPTALEGNMIKRDWWNYYDSKESPNFDKIIMSVDAAFKDEKQNDYVAIEVWGKKDADIYLIDVINEHLDFPNTIRKIKVTRARYKDTSEILIEDKANGSGIIQILRHQIMGIIPITPNSSKESRVNAVSFAIEAGNVYLPKDKNFTWEFIEQCSSFPNGKHDDMVDSMSQALTRLIVTRTFKKEMKRTQKGDRFFNISKPKRRERGEKINVI